MPFKDRMSEAKLRFARQMHKNPTASEAALWARLRRGQLGVQFKSQECILGYIVDFYCPRGYLVVELDGSIHHNPDKRASDAKRDRAFRRHGLRILRLPSELSTDDAVARIEKKLIWLQVKRAKPSRRPYSPSIAA
jgi:very-short-patch-repair endonuclease